MSAKECLSFFLITMFSIDVSGISKVFRIYDNPTLRLKEIIIRKKCHREFMALKGVSFSLIPGDTLGLFGDNGAGKSTLLKILAGTLAPTSGVFNVNGRVTALLELGAGFHPEFTGRQNIYLNAALFGMSEEEIRDREGDIIAFSELGDFIDQPVKTYSSGMYVRLAFSIATSIDPEVLIVDEALSVGDQHFQKKCIDRMIHFCEAKKTIVFCSHSIYHLQQLCKKGIWLHEGEIRMQGPIRDALDAYQDYVRELEGKNKGNTAEDKELARVAGHGDRIVCIDELWLENGKGKRASQASTGQDVRLRMRIRALKEGVKGHVGLGILRNDEMLCFGTTTLIDGKPAVEFYDGRDFCLHIDSMPLLPGSFMVYGLVTDEHGLHAYDISRSEPIKVSSDSGYYGITAMGHEWRL